MSKNRAILNVIGFIGAERCIGYSPCVSSYTAIRYSFNNYDFGSMICAKCNQPLKPLNSTMICSWVNNNDAPVETMISSRLCDACHMHRIHDMNPAVWHTSMSEHLNKICDMMALTLAQRNEFSIQHLLYLCARVAENEHATNIFANVKSTSNICNVYRYVRLNTMYTLFHNIRKRTNKIPDDIRNQINRLYILPAPTATVHHRRIHRRNLSLTGTGSIERMNNQRIILAPNDHNESTLVRNDGLRINDRADSVIIPINEPRIIKTNDDQSVVIHNIFDTILSPAVMNFIRSTFCLPCIIP